jgi:hypothetical protein
LRIESMFPADEETESEHLILLEQNTLRKEQIAFGVVNSHGRQPNP